MRRYKRGVQLVVCGLVVTIILFSSVALWPSTTPRPSHIHQINTTAFLASVNRMQVEPRQGLQACHNGPVEVLVVVPSSPRHYQARQALRASWRPYLPPSWPLMFYLGSVKDHKLQKQIEQEGQQYGDIAQDTSFLDSYNNLTLKTLGLVSWANRFCKDAKYVLKVDDDIFLNIRKLQDLINCIDFARDNIYKKLYQPSSYEKGSPETKTEDSTAVAKRQICEVLNPISYVNYYVNSQNHKYESYLLGGYLYSGIKADRNPKSKWYLDPSTYQPDTLPPFLSGTAYIISINLLPHLLYEAKHHPAITLEDVYLSGIVATQGLKLKLSHVTGWSRFRPWWDSVCTYKKLLTAHGLSPEDMTSMMHAVAKTEESECDGMLVSITNSLNSLISSLLPRVPG